jgi:hypothetical protein
MMRRPYGVNGHWLAIRIRIGWAESWDPKTMHEPKNLNFGWQWPSSAAPANPARIFIRNLVGSSVGSYFSASEII